MARLCTQITKNNSTHQLDKRILTHYTRILSFLNNNNIAISFFFSFFEITKKRMDGTCNQTVRTSTTQQKKKTSILLLWEIKGNVKMLEDNFWRTDRRSLIMMHTRQTCIRTWTYTHRIDSRSSSCLYYKYSSSTPTGYYLCNFKLSAGPIQKNKSRKIKKVTRFLFFIIIIIIIIIHGLRSFWKLFLFKMFFFSNHLPFVVAVFTFFFYFTPVKLFSHVIWPYTFIWKRK